MRRAPARRSSSTPRRRPRGCKLFAGVPAEADIREAYQGAVDQFIEVYKGNAIVTKCCQVAGLGNVWERDGSFAYYMSEPIVANDCKGSGAMLQAAVEMEGYGKY